MYCVKCGVKLADTETKCPLCHTVVYHPDLPPVQAQPLYPAGKMPKSSSGTAVLNGAVLFLFFIPLTVCFLADFSMDRCLNWFGYVAGALVLAYVALALPRWFQKPNPVIFTPCSFAVAAAYLWYIALATGGRWFFPFALPLLGALALITCAVVTLMHYVGKGKLYMFGGALIALGGWMLLTEFLLQHTFGLPFTGWSVYPLVVLVLLGLLLIYFAINRSARERWERKLFF